MPRAYGRFTTSIWLDPDFTALTLEQQGAYFTLGLQPDVTAAGVLPYTSRRWSKLSAGTTRADFEKLVTLLVESDGEHLVVDEDTEEVLIRKFIKWDMGWANTQKRLKVVLDAVDAVASPRIREAAIRELLKIPESGIGTQDSRDALSAELKIRYPQNLDTQSRSDRVVVTTTHRTTSTHNPETATPNPQPATPVPVAQTAPRGTRIKETWRPTIEDIGWARARGIPDAQSRDETEKFVNHWLSKAGKDATKIEWSRTWRNWMMTAVERSGIRGGGVSAPATEKAQGWLSLAVPDEQYAIEGEPA